MKCISIKTLGSSSTTICLRLASCKSRISFEWNLNSGQKKHSFFAHSADTLTHIYSYTHYHTPHISFQFHIHCPEVPLYYSSTEPGWGCRQSFLSVWSLPACCCPLTGCRVVEGLLTEAGICFLLSLLPFRSAWFRLTVFLAPLALQRARVNSILEPLPMLVLALIVCALSLSLSGSLSEIWGLKASTSAKPPSAPLSLFHSLFPLLSPFLFVYNTPSPAHTLFHLSDVRKIKGFAVVTGFCRHNSPPDWWLFGLDSHHQTVACIKILSVPWASLLGYKNHISPRCEWWPCRYLLYREMRLTKPQPDSHMHLIDMNKQPKDTYFLSVKIRSGKQVCSFHSFR